MARKKHSKARASETPKARASETPKARASETPKARASETPTVRAVRSALLDARPEEPVLDVVQRLQRRTRSLGRALVWLAMHDASDQVRQSALETLLAAAKDPSFPPDLAGTLLGQAANAAAALRQDPSLSAAEQALCTAVVGLAADELGPEETAELEGLALAQLEALARDLEDTAEGAELLLGPTGLDWLEPPGGRLADDQLALGIELFAALGLKNPTVAVTLLATAAAIGHQHRVAPALIDRALDAIEQGPPGRALWLLDELGRWPATGTLGERARQGAARLAARGAGPQPPRTGALVRAAVSHIDGAGCRSVALVFARGDGATDGVMLLLHDALGIKDAFGVWEGGAAIDEHLRSADGMVYASCSLTFVRRLLSDALATHAATGRPVPGRFLLLRPLFGLEPLPVALHAPDLSTYLLETFVRSPALAAGTDLLARTPPFDRLGFDSDAAYAFVRARPTTPRGIKARKQLDADLLVAVEPAERGRVVARLAANLEVLALAGQGKTTAARKAAGLYLALAEGLVPWTDVPYVQALVPESLARIRANVQMGYASQTDANAALLARQAEESSLF